MENAEQGLYYTTISEQMIWGAGKETMYVFVRTGIKELWRETQENNNIWLPVGEGKWVAGRSRLQSM